MNIVFWVLQVLLAVAMLLHGYVILPGLTGILPWLTPLAAVGLIVVMGSAIIYHFQTGDRKGATGPLVMLVVALVVAYGRFAVAHL
jgi:hypothetical protein